MLANPDYWQTAPDGKPYPYAEGSLSVPDEPIIPYVEGDGTGIDIWPAAQLVMEGQADLIITPDTRCFAASSGDTGWVIETRWPPSFKTRNDRFCASPPTKSKTTSTFSRRTFSNCSSR